VITQVLRALAYLHDYAGICHRDLKLVSRRCQPASQPLVVLLPNLPFPPYCTVFRLENVVLENAGEHIHVRLIDFGISQKFGVNEKMRGACGTVSITALCMRACTKRI
jgi:serine/threonine protein kinase